MLNNYYLTQTSSSSLVTAILKWTTDPRSSVPAVYPQAGSAEADARLEEYLKQLFGGER